MSSLVAVSRDGPVTTVMLNRPDRLNTMTWDIVRQLQEVLGAIGRDRDCRVVILTGAGRAFCAGLEMTGYGDDERVSLEGPVGLLTRQREIASTAQTLHGLPQPVIGAVNGAAAGGGLALVCASDIRIASERAVFGVSFIRAGYSACDVGTSWLLPRIVGVARAHEWMLTGRIFDANEAAAAGLVTQVVAPEDLMAAARAKADEICLNPPASVALTKQGMWIALETPSFDASVEFENRQQLVSAMTDDSAEATRAFLEKRAPSYRNR